MIGRRRLTTAIATLLGAILLPAGAATTALAADKSFMPALIYDIGGKADKSFNEAAYVGAERFRRETGIAYRDFEVTNESQREQAMTAMVRRGATIVVAIGFDQRTSMEQVARQHPETRFTIVDEVIDLPNVQSVIYREHEGSFLVGMLAALASKTGKVGFVGGMDVPLVRKFAVGYAEGARYVRPGIEVLQNMTGTTPAAWHDPARGGELARSQFDRGVDVVFAAAGTTGLGILQAAKDAGRLGIGVDSNQDYLFPGTMLTSMVKRVDLAVYEAFKAARDGTWKPGRQSLGLAEDGVAYALDEYNDKLITPEMRAKVDAARADIIAGRITVTDAMASPAAAAAAPAK
ncbi:MAG TPA: BMP family ABC transporter substrate-binding protein [Stellaceae bacterium]